MADDLNASNYLSLGTWRKNGTVVDTPVWFAAEGEDLYVFSAGNAGKVKRLRNSPRARVAPCNMTGKLLGEWRDATAEIIADEASVEQAHKALVRRYGLQMRLLDLMSWVGGKINKRAFIRIRLES